MNRSSSILFSSEFHVGYRYAFNGKETETTVNTGAYDFGARMYDGRLGRWWSVDALQAKFPFSSTYVFALNSPNSIVDPDGKDNIIYIVVLPSGKSFLKHRGGAKAVKKEMDKRCDQMMLRTKTVIFNRPNEIFDPSKLDPTDTYILLGSVAEAKDYYQKNQLNHKFLKRKDGEQLHETWIDFDHIEKDTDVFETTCSGSSDNHEPATDGGGCGGVIATDRLPTITKKFALSTVETIALLGLHVAFGHNSNNSHERTAPLANEGCIIAHVINEKATPCINEAGEDVNVPNTLSLDSFYFESAMHVDFYKHIQSRFGINKAKDNYDRNSAKK
ncbi:MAG: hypothetical protein RL092_1077 [Bacteroidota bacterium]|jgi:RHS repeat-associated protein